MMQLIVYLSGPMFLPEPLTQVPCSFWEPLSRGISVRGHLCPVDLCPGRTPGTTPPPPLRYGKEHPTGMHSCFFNIFYIDGNGVLMVMRPGCGSLM